MLRKFALTAAIATALAAPTAALAKGPGPHMGMHGGPGHWHHHWRPHHWHGRWWYGPQWGYGGNCWRWDPYAGGWAWACY